MIAIRTAGLCVVFSLAFSAASGQTVINKRIPDVAPPGSAPTVINRRAPDAANNRINRASEDTPHGHAADQLIKGTFDKQKTMKGLEGVNPAAVRMNNSKVNIQKEAVPAMQSR